MTQEPGKLRPEADWPRLDQQFAEALDVLRRSAELERMDNHPALERLGALDEGLEDLKKAVGFCGCCLVAIAALLAVIALRIS